MVAPMSGAFARALSGRVGPRARPPCTASQPGRSPARRAAPAETALLHRDGSPEARRPKSSRQFIHHWYPPLACAAEPRAAARCLWADGHGVHPYQTGRHGGPRYICSWHRTYAYGRIGRARRSRPLPGVGGVIGGCGMVRDAKGRCGMMRDGEEGDGCGVDHERVV
jgi:hypothetical protein